MEVESTIQKSKFLDFVNFKAIQSAFQISPQGSNSVTLQIPGGSVVNLKKTVLSFTADFGPVAAGTNVHLIYSDLFSWINTIRVNIDSQQVVYVPEFQKVSKMLGLMNQNYESGVSSWYYKKKQHQRKIEFESTIDAADTNGSIISVKDIPHLFYLYGKNKVVIGGARTYQANTTYNSDGISYCQYDNMGATINTDDPKLVQIELGQLLPFSIFDQEMIYIKDQLELQLTFDSGVNISFQAALFTTNAGNQAGAQNSTEFLSTAAAQAANCDISNLQLIVARYRHLRAEDVPKNILIHYQDIKHAIRSNETIRYPSGGLIGSRLDYQLLSFFTAGSNTAANNSLFNKYNNANVGFIGTDGNVRITSLELQVDNQNLLQNASSLEAEYLGIRQFNMPKFVKQDVSDFQSNNHCWILDYTSTGKYEDRFDGKEILSTDRSLAFAASLGAGGDAATHQYVVSSIFTRILQYDQDMNVRLI